MKIRDYSSDPASLSEPAASVTAQLTLEQSNRLLLDFPDGESRCIWADGRGEHRIYRNLVVKGVCREGERQGAFYLTALGRRVVKRLLDSSRKTSA